MSVTTAYEFVTVGNREGHGASRDLDRSAADRTLTSDELSLAIRLISTRDGSVGITWILKNQQRFIDCVPRDERLAFFEEHYDNPSIISVATSYELLRSMLPIHRDDFIREVVARHLIPGWEWIADAFRLGVSAELLRQQVLNRLAGTILDKEATDEFIVTFLDKGAGRVVEASRFYEERQCFTSLDTYTLWAVFTDEETFIKALQICARHQPELFFVDGDPSLQERLTIRLFRYQIQEVLDVAVDALTSFEKVRDWGLESLSATAKERLANRALPGSLGFVVRLMLSSLYETECVDVDYLSALDFSNICQRAAPTDRREVLALFQELYRDVKHAMSSELPQVQSIYDELVKLLARHTYVIGTVDTDTHQGRRQYFVHYDHRRDNPNGFAVKYVLFAKERHPECGTPVIIDVHDPANKCIHGGGKIVLTKFISMNGGNITA